MREDVVGWDAAAGGTSPPEYVVELPSVVGNHCVREQRQSAADEHEFFASPAAIGTDRPVVNRSLELMDRFSAHAKSIDGAAKRGLRRIGAQMYGMPALTELCESGMGFRASGGGAESFERIGCRGVTVLDGCGQMDDVVVFAVNEPQVNISTQGFF